MEPLNLRRLHHLVAVADHGSIAHAADTLNLSASALSVSLKELERSVGVTLLLRRSGEGVVLTAEGVQLVARARELLTTADDLHRLIATEVSGATAPVSIGSLVTVAPIVLPRLVKAARGAHPDVPVDVRTGAQDVLIEMLAGGAIHLAVTYDLGVGQKVAFEPLVPAPAHVALPARHRLARRSSVRLSELAGEPFIALDLPLSREYFFSLLLSEGVPWDPRHSMTDIELVRSAVGNGLGWSLVNLVPPRASAIDGSRLAHVPVATSHPPLQLGIATWRERRLPASAHRIVETFRHTLRPEG